MAWRNPKFILKSFKGAVGKPHTPAPHPPPPLDSDVAPFYPRIPNHESYFSIHSNAKDPIELLVCLKKNLNASRPSDYPPVRGGKMSNRLLCVASALCKRDAKSAIGACWCTVIKTLCSTRAAIRMRGASSAVIFSSVRFHGSTLVFVWLSIYSWQQRP